MKCQAHAEARAALSSIARLSCQGLRITRSNLQTRVGCSKRSNQICSASQFKRIIAAAAGCALTACTHAPSMTAR
jgi:hypothetical protein